MMILELHRPESRTSKANLCFDALATAYETVNNFDASVDPECISVFWGLGGNNSAKIKHCVQSRIPWLFVDMPYWHRWTANNLDWSIAEAHWRFVPNAFHPTAYHEFKNNRLSDIGVSTTEVELKNTVLICPSSDTLTNHCLGFDSNEWILQTVELVKRQFPDRQIKIRHKPRNKYTSGPDAATISIEDELADCCAVVGFSTIALVDAAAYGIPTYYTHSGFSPTEPIGTNLIKFIGKNNNRELWLNTLSNYQYSLKEITANKLDDILKCYLQ
jgi:hypothetical protein